MTKSSHTIDMCNGSVLKKMLLFALPLMLSGMLQLVFNAADVMVVGRFAEDGTSSLAAVGSTSSLINLLTNLFMKRPGVLRSLHPTHSIAVWGRESENYIRGEEDAVTPCPIGGAWGRLRHIGAKILLIGVTHVNNTFIHSIDEVFDVPGRLVEKPITLSVKMPDGSLYPRTYYPHEGHVSLQFDKLRKAYETLGAAKDVRFGDAKCILCDAKGIFEVTARVYAHDKECFTSLDAIPEEWWKE